MPASQILGMLSSHPNVAALLQTYEDEEAVHIVLELVRGPPCLARAWGLQQAGQAWGLQQARQARVLLRASSAEALEAVAGHVVQTAGKPAHLASVVGSAVASLSPTTHPRSSLNQPTNWATNLGDVPHALLLFCSARAASCLTAWPSRAC